MRPTEAHIGLHLFVQMWVQSILMRWIFYFPDPSRSNFLHLFHEKSILLHQYRKELIGEQKMALPAPPFPCMCMLGRPYGHWFSTIILISQVGIWKSQTNTDAAWQLNTWARSVACQGHAGCTLHVLCYLSTALHMAWIYWKLKG